MRKYSEEFKWRLVNEDWAGRLGYPCLAQNMGYPARTNCTLGKGFRKRGLARLQQREMGRYGKEAMVVGSF